MSELNKYSKTLTQDVTQPAAQAMYYAIGFKEEDFKKMVESQGYKIKKFKQPGSCYEIYGTDKEGKKVEIYFNPVDGSPIKSK